jgi:hypothetical protein
VNESKRSISAGPHSLGPQMLDNRNESKRSIPVAPIPLGRPNSLRPQVWLNGNGSKRFTKEIRLFQAWETQAWGFCSVIRKSNFDRHHCFTPESQREGVSPVGVLTVVLYNQSTSGSSFAQSPLA